MLPQLLIMRISDSRKHFRLFIPLVLLYLLVLPLFILIAVIYGLLFLLPGTKEARSWMKIVFYSPKILAAARGMEIDVRSHDSDVRFLIH